MQPCSYFLKMSPVPVATPTAAPPTPTLGAIANPINGALALMT